jgi:hypothetical protein
MPPANDEKWQAGIEKSSRNRLASAVPTFCDEIQHKLFSASWRTPGFPKFISLVGTVLVV